MLGLGLAACGGGGGGGASAPAAATYTLSGIVSGLTGTGLVLQDNGADNKAITANGAFTFTTSANSGNYAVTVLTQPTGPAQTCTVNSGSGPLSGANITNVAVVCSTNTYTVSGTVSGLTGSGLVLQNNAADNKTISANGAFTFTAPVASGANYNVTVLTQPSGPTQTCTVNSGSGIVSTANVSNVAVVCSTNTYTIGGTVSGLTGTGLVLRNNGGDNLAVPTNASSFTFATAIAAGSGYSVSVLTQPTGQTCSVTNGSGSNVQANVSNVAVSCTVNSATPWASVSAGAGHTIATKTDGTLWAWGRNDFGQLGDGTIVDKNAPTNIP